MIIKPQVQGVISRSAHPLGCEKALLKQIDYVKKAPSFKAPKRVLILGASSGFGLAARIALTFAGNADTIGVSFEKAPSEQGTGSAGWYNDYYFKQQASGEGRLAINIHGDAFSTGVRDDVIEAIETYFEGEVDLIIYSIATGIRPDPKTGQCWRSALKPIGQAYHAVNVSFENDQWIEQRIEPATEEEITATVKVMGGEDWESWVDMLINAESVAMGCQALSFSYIGSEQTDPIYFNGTLGHAKVDLHQASHRLNLKLAQFNGGAHVAVCKALVTKASVFIPGFAPYLMSLFKAMKGLGNHEGCIEQMHRLFSQKFIPNEKIELDAERLIRMDDWELSPNTQRAVKEILTELNANNFLYLSDYLAIKKEFMQLNGFDFDEIDYQLPVDLAPFIEAEQSVY